MHNSQCGRVFSRIFRAIRRYLLQGNWGSFKVDDVGRMILVVVEDLLLQYVVFERVRVLGWDGVQWKMDPNPTSVNNQ